MHRKESKVEKTYLEKTLSLHNLNMGRHVSFFSWVIVIVYQEAVGLCSPLFLGCENRLAASTRFCLCNVCMQELQPSCRRRHLRSSGFQLLIPALLPMGTASSSPLLPHVKANWFPSK